ncbi:alpha/beta hydrolase family protein [Alteromonas sp. McT4-15]|uniref:DUF3530 family protein n=1 Tax=Alteromonas sp. McT4-15 TaxID=2881256 RepID=UPI001CF852B2|nr:DUF3530 family protein [Alteromonas sp. McT4-15]MCB4437932.1 alpha/beta hydrolase family protein [Alteromonas sp. McT4-15]
MTKHLCSLLFLMIPSVYSSAAVGDFFTDISHAYLPGQVKEIIAGDTILPIVEVDAHTPLPLGTAIIISELSPAGLTMGQGDLLAEKLAEKGWNVVISPFEQPLHNDAQTTSQVEGENSPAQSDDVMTTSTDIHPRSNQLTQHLDFDDTKNKLSMQLNALNNYLQERQGYRLVIAQGMLAASFLSLASTQPALHPDTFVAISPFWPDSTINDLVVDNIAQSDFPILDLAVGNYSKWASSTAAQRRVSAKNALKLHYRQVEISGSPLVFSIKSEQESSYIHTLTNTTIGWTRHLGW